MVQIKASLIFIISGLKLIGMNINSIRGKKAGIAGFA